jgi:hypothetical protein
MRVWGSVTLASVEFSLFYLPLSFGFFPLGFCIGFWGSFLPLIFIVVVILIW